MAVWAAQKLVLSSFRNKIFAFVFRMRHLKTSIFQGCCVAVLFIWLWSYFRGKKDGGVFQSFLDSVPNGSPFFWKYVFKRFFILVLCFAPTRNLICSRWHWLIRRVFPHFLCDFGGAETVCFLQQITQEWCNFSGKMFFPPLSDKWARF